MAIIRTLPGNPGPVNQGEEIVLAHLAKNLPDTFTLIPNITIGYERDNAEEHDIVAVGPDGVFIVEVKTLAGVVVIDEQTMTVDGDQRSNPWLSTRRKAQKLASRLEQRCGREPKVWVEHVVVFSRPPRSLEIDEQYKNRIFIGADAVVPYLMPPSRIINPRGHGSHANRTAQIVDAIIGGAEARQVRKRFGEYHARERANAVTSPNQIEYWHAEHRRHGGTRLLYVYPPTDRQNNQNQAKRFAAQQRTAVADKIGPSADIIASYESFETDAGEFVVVWPMVDSPPLSRHLARLVADEERNSLEPITDSEARKLIEGFASAYSDLHISKYVFGKLNEDAFVVRPSGRGAVVLQDPLPVPSNDPSADLAQLASIAESIVELTAKAGSAGEIVQRFKESLKSIDRAEQPSAGWLAAACQVGIQRQASLKKLADLFGDLREVATHTFGKTYIGVNKKTKTKSVIRIESGRPGESWVGRETRALKFTEVIRSSGTVQWLDSGEVEEGAFVETEWLDGVSLSTILDSNLLAIQPDAVKATLQVLAILDEIHPDLDALDALLDSSGAEPTAEQLEKIMQIRMQGVAHNHIEPSNIIWVEKRGPVLIDFVRASELGRVIPVRLSAYWPPRDDRAQSNPTADLYAVGLILLAMLTGSLNPYLGSADTIESRIARVRKDKPALADIISKAISEDPNTRYRTAKQFIDALVGLGLSEVKPFQVADVLALYREIEVLVAVGRFDQALKICVENEWYETAENIKRKKQLVVAAGQELVHVDGVKLTYLGTKEVGPGNTVSNRPYKRGLAHVYLIRMQEGGVLEVHTVTAKPINEETQKELDEVETWVQGDLEFGLPEHVQMLADRRRLTVNALEERDTDEEIGEGLSYCEIRQLQLKDLDPEGRRLGSRWEATNKKVTESQLRIGASGADVFELLSKFGALGTGTRLEVINDDPKSKRKGDLCVKFKFAERAVHVPVIVFLIARFLPLKNKVVAR